ncbi:MAG TPA: hypothetical protein VLT84_11790, partial [Acidobacteriota bacterium]|nr:hypothetical protein [Acidobacteriota bacterium]
MRGRSSGETVARLRAALLASLILATPGLIGCGREAPGAREARETVRAFLAELRAHDEARLRGRATCIVPSDGVADARLRRVDPPLALLPSTLDSLAAAYTGARLRA